MDAPSANSPHEIELSKNINLFNLDKNIANLISGYLINKDLVNVCCASKNLHSIFYPFLEKRLMFYFLKYVVAGRLDKVEEILNRNQKLVLLQGDITDLSGRVFKKITAFQYATWALDKEMWELILRYLPEADAYTQLTTFEQERPDITKAHGTRLNFAPLLDMYQQYLDNYCSWDWDQREACWCKEVGGAQRQMPAWFVYVFCEEGKDKAWPKNDFKKSFTRDPKHLRWFDEEEYGGKVGAYRGDGGEVFFCGAVGAQEGFVKAVEVERLTTSQFMWGRTAELLRLVERLSQVWSREKNSAIKLNNSRK